MSDRSQGSINLRDKFPDLEPIRTLPMLWNIAGFGFGMFGSRDADAQTGSVVKTHCLSALGIPVVAIAAYRIAIAADGLYFLGKQPLSSFAKVWNCLFLTCVIALGGGYFWSQHTQSPEYIAAQSLAKANGYLESGDVVDAARTYRDVAMGNAPRAAATAKEALRGILGHQSRETEPKPAAEILQIAVELQLQDSTCFDSGELVRTGTELSEKATAADPRNALALVDAVLPLANKPDDLTPRRQQLLETIVQKEPQDPEAASQLAVIYESQSQMEKCEKLLAPHHDRLGIHEGARVLGQIFAKRGEHDKAVVLLMPYTEGRLKNLHAADEALTQAVQNIQKRVLDEIKNGKAPKSFYARAQNAREAEQQAMIIEYIESKTKDDPELKRRQQDLVREAPIVPVALDLGIALLQKGQGLTDPDARRAEMEKAEKVFLSVRGLAGEQDEYRLSLGRVYYWLGKEKEGREQFDSLLQANNRDTNMLIAVGHTLREIGAEADSRALSEEAYNKATDNEKKHHAAYLRSLMRLDLDDEIVWLGRSNPAIPEVKAQLSKSKASQAARDGNDELAIQHLKDAIAVYNAQSETDVTLNNAALLYFSLFHLNGDTEALESRKAKLEKALALNPGDSILIVNSASAILEGAMRSIIGDSIDLNLLKTGGSVDLLAYLYETDSGRQAYVDRVRTNADVEKALKQLEKGLVLAPKRASAYEAVVSIREYTRDVNALEEMLKRIEQAEPDYSDEIQRMHKYYAGTDDATYRKDADSAISRSESTLRAAKAKGGATFAVAATSLAGQLIAANAFGRDVDANRIVELAEQAYAAAPSVPTHSTLTNALCFRASKTISQKDAEFAEMLAKANRSLGHSYVLALALAREGKLRDAVLADPDVQRATTRLVESLEKFPEEYSPWDWAMLQDGRPDVQEKLAETIKKNETMQMMLKISRRLSPASGRPIMEAYFALQMAGDEAGAKDILRQFKEKEIPLPFDVDKF